MKFAQGAWRLAEGVTMSNVRRVSESRISNDTLIVCGLDRHGTEGVDKFEGTVLQIEITSPMPNVIRVRTRHHSPAERPHHGFEIDSSLRASDVRITDGETHLQFTSGRLTLRVRKGRHWDFRFEDDTGQLVTAGPELAYARVAGTKQEPLSHGRLREGMRPGAFLMQRLSMGVGETIYGLGERFGPLVKNGQSVAIWNEDGGTCSDLAYKNIPFYLSSRGYGLFVNHPGQVEFEVGTERVSQMQFSVPGEELDYFVFLGEPKTVLDHYTRLTGRPPVPPAWSFGLWLSTSFTTKYDESTVNAFLDGMAERGIPLSVFHFDCFWMKERHWCNFEWDRDAFPDPEAMLARLKSRGLKVCVWINPYVSQMSELFAEGRTKGFFLKRVDGSVYQRDAWQPGMALVDFTNPAAFAWYRSHLKRLLDGGVDCFKTDFAELIPLDVVYHDGSDPERMHNFYSYLYNQCVFECVARERGAENALVFARSATAGSQKFPVHWGGDCAATWEAMAEDLRGGLSFCSSGPAYWSHDIGGFEGTADAANYKRWVAFGLLSTHSRLHGSSSYRVPWLFDDEAVDVMRHFTTFKNRLFPYLFAASHDAAEHGWPVLRTMFVEYPDDPGCRYLDRQYMLGSSLMVAPVFDPSGVCEHYMPRGTWVDFLTGEIVQGGVWRKSKCDYFGLPLLLREDSIVPMSANESSPQWSQRDELILHVGHLTANATATLRVVPSDGGEPMTFALTRDADRVTLRCDAIDGRVKLLLRGRQQIDHFEHIREQRHSAEGVCVEWDDLTLPLTFSTDSPADREPSNGTKHGRLGTAERLTAQPRGVR